MHFWCAESLCGYACVMLKALYMKHDNNTQPNLIMRYISHSFPPPPLHPPPPPHTHTHTQSRNPSLPNLSQSPRPPPPKQQQPTHASVSQWRCQQQNQNKSRLTWLQDYLFASDTKMCTEVFLGNVPFITLRYQLDTIIQLAMNKSCKWMDYIYMCVQRIFKETSLLKISFVQQVERDWNKNLKSRILFWKCPLDFTFSF